RAFPWLTTRGLGGQTLADRGLGHTSWLTEYVVIRRARPLYRPVGGHGGKGRPRRGYGSAACASVMPARSVGKTGARPGLAATTDPGAGGSIPARGDVV